MYVYPEGRVVFYRKRQLSIKCEFNFARIPSDEHNCFTTSYISNNFVDTAVLRYEKRDDVPRPDVGFLTWDIKLKSLSETRIKYKTSASSSYSGIKLGFFFKRQSDFLFRLFIIPSLMFTLLAYSSFYID